MTNNDSSSVASKPGGRFGSAVQPQQKRSFFDIPPPLKRIFDRFPLVSYAENDRPLRALVAKQEEHALHLFATKEGAKDGRPSFNPGCLKWQAYLRFSEIPFRTVPSTNHASPSGVLPFLLPAAGKDEGSTASAAVTTGKMRKWAFAHSPKSIEEPEDLRYEAYASLVDTGLRKAWLYQLYLNPANSGLAHELYVAPCSSNSLVQLAIAQQLQQAAEAELTKSSFSGIVSEADIALEADKAIEALATLLGSDKWFFRQSQPSFLDACVFAYTHLSLDEELRWGENGLAEQLKQHQSLVNHRDRILKHYF